MQLEELSSESESTPTPRPQFGGPHRPKMPPKGSLGDPLDAPWTALGSLRGSVGRSGSSWDALWTSSGALWSSSGVLWELRGVILELSGTILEAFWDHLGTILEHVFEPPVPPGWPILRYTSPLRHLATAFPNQRGPAAWGRSPLVI